MEAARGGRTLLYLLLFACCSAGASASVGARRSSARRSGESESLPRPNGAKRLSPPLDIQLETLNCTAFSVRWKMPRRHVSTITGYKVFYTEMRSGRPVGSASLMEVPLSLDMLTTGQFDGQASFDVAVGNLKINTKYRVSVGAYGWAGEGRPSVPRDVSTASHDMCMPPAPPTTPVVMVVSDNELALSWQQGESEGSDPVLHFLVAYIRPEMDTEWTYIREPIQTSSMVLRGLLPDTEYQFVVRAVNVHGMSPPSSINSPVRTPGPSDVGSADYGLYNTDLGPDEDSFDVDDSDYDVFIEELNPFPGIPRDNRKSQLRSRSGPPSGRNVVYRMNPIAPPNATAPPARSSPAASEPDFTDLIFPTTLEPTTTSTTTPPPTTTTMTTTTTSTLPPPTAPPTLSPWRGDVARVYDLSCDDTVCPPDSFCLSDYDGGGSRCHCNLGRQGETCNNV
ncbi:pikachurin-like [Eucyclogobius newberryi]|uniref:pikachurin-like n=1 Tax=Eucyclogobius newberryi TaxID=166745 RepID=UPI003B59EB91